MADPCQSSLSVRGTHEAIAHEAISHEAASHEAVCREGEQDSIPVGRFVRRGAVNVGVVRVGWGGPRQCCFCSAVIFSLIVINCVPASCKFTVKRRSLNIITVASAEALGQKLELPLQALRASALDDAGKIWGFDSRACRSERV